MRGCGRDDMGVPLWGECSGAQSRVLPVSAPLSTRLGLGTSHHVSFLQRIPNSLLVGLVQERLSEDDCLRRVRLHGTAWLGVVTRKGGRDVSIFEATEKVKLATRS